MNLSSFLIPADIPSNARSWYEQNYKLVTRDTGRLFLLVYDHIIEHMNQELWNKQYTSNVISPEQPFMIAQAGHCGAFAAPAGLIARYGTRYPTLNYVVKLTGKTGCMPGEPSSTPLATIDDVLALKANGSLSVCGVGVTIYLGSAYENEMLTFAAHTFAKARAHGLLTCAWMYPRGHAIANEYSPTLSAGAVSIALALGADFVKIHVPHADWYHSNEPSLKDIVQAAGATKVLCAGQEMVEAPMLLQRIATQLYEDGTSGCAIGRNIFLRPLAEAVGLSQAIEALVYRNASVSDAQQFLTHACTK